MKRDIEKQNPEKRDFQLLPKKLRGGGRFDAPFPESFCRQLADTIQLTKRERFAWIEEQQNAWPVTVLCHYLNVSRAGYYKWKANPVGKVAARHEKIAALIRRIHQEVSPDYGSPRMCAELQSLGWLCCENTVAKVMQGASIHARQLPKRTRQTTRNRKILSPNSTTNDLLRRNFRAEGINETWSIDITEIVIDNTPWFLCAAMDLYSRKIVGHGFGDEPSLQLVIETLSKGILSRNPAKGLVIHSDGGWPFSKTNYLEFLYSIGLVPSKSHSSCFDNAPIESFFRTLKMELVYWEQFEDAKMAQRVIETFIDNFYNTARRHRSLGLLGPTEFETYSMENKPSNGRRRTD